MSFLAGTRRCSFAHVKSITAAVPVRNRCSSVLTSTVKLRCSVFTRRRFATSQGSASSDAPETAIERKLVSHFVEALSSSDESNTEGELDVGKPQTTACKSFGSREKKESLFDSKEQQVGPINPRDEAFLNAVVKVFCTRADPDYSLPWKKQRQIPSTGSAFVIGDGKILTNAHCVKHETQVKVMKRGDETKYVAKVLARDADCDIALLSVESKEFWEGVEPISLGSLPHLQDSVTVVGYPRGGDTISITKGVVSRMEACSPEYAQNTGYLIPTTVVSHLLNDYERNKKYTGFPWLGVLLQKLENPALRECLKVKSNEGLLVRRIEPTSDAHNVLKKGDVIVSFDDVHLGCGGTVLFRSNERIAFRYLINQKFAGDVAELGIIRAGEFMKVQVVLNPQVHLVAYDIGVGQPSYLIIAGFVFTPLSEPLIDDEGEDSIGVALMAKSCYSLSRFKGEQIVILSQVLSNEVNVGYEDMSNQQLLKLNGTRIKNIHHLAHLVDSCKDKYLVFEFEDNYIAVLEREAATAASPSILKDYGIPSERSADMSEPYVDPLGDNQATDQESGEVVMA